MDGPREGLARGEPPDRVSLGVVGAQQRGIGRPVQDRGQLPGQVVRTLDGGVGSAGLERRHGVGRVADEKHSATSELVGHPLVGLPRRDIDDLHVDRLTNGFESASLGNAAR